MAKVHHRRLVIDADVARASGASEHPISSSCRRFLATVLESGHYAVMTATLMDEWRRNGSRYSAIWLRQMYARKLVHRDHTLGLNDLRSRIDAALHGRERVSAEKDIHLIEAALATDRLVASRDDHARNAFRNASVVVRVLRRIVWVNPTCVADNPIDWLESGARTEAFRKLGA